MADAPTTYDADYWAAYEAVHNIQLAFVAAAAILFWDGILTFRDLRRSVLPRKWDITKLAVLWNWLWPRFVHIPICGVSDFMQWTEDGCHKAALLHPYICLFSLCAAQLILVLRVIACYGSATVSYAVLALFFACQVVACVLPAVLLTSIPIIPGITGCGPMAKPDGYANGLWLVFLPSFVLECVALSLVVGKLIWVRRSQQSFLYKVCRDDLTYFGAVVCINLANIILIAVDPGFSNGLLWMPAVALTSIITHRCMLDTRSDDMLNFSSFNPTHPELPNTNEGVKIKMQSHRDVDSDKDETDKSETSLGPRLDKRPMYPSNMVGSFLDIEQ